VRALIGDIETELGYIAGYGWVLAHKRVKRVIRDADQLGLTAVKRALTPITKVKAYDGSSEAQRVARLAYTHALRELKETIKEPAKGRYTDHHDAIGN
jgi:hypothetical protein